MSTYIYNQNDIDVDCHEERPSRVPTLGLHPEEQTSILRPKPQVDHRGDRHPVVDQTCMSDLRYSSTCDSGVGSELQEQFSELLLTGHSDERADTGLEQSLKDLPSHRTDTSSSLNSKSHIEESLQKDSALGPSINNNTSSFGSFISTDIRQQLKNEPLAYSPFDQDGDGDTQLHIAIIKLDSVAAIDIIKQCPDYDYLNTPNCISQTALHLSVITKQHDVTRRLMGRGARLDARDRNGNTPLHHACRTGDMLSVNILTRPISMEEELACPYPLPYRVIPQQLNILNYEGATCLHLAVYANHMDIVKLLISPTIGADVNAKDGCSGRTILHHAILMNDLDLIKHLLECTNSLPVNVDQLTYDGNTALQLAHGCNLDQEVKDLLINAGADHEMIEPAIGEGESFFSSDDEEMEYDDFTVSGEPVQTS